MKIQRLIAVIMVLGSSVLIAGACGDIAFPAILCMLGLLGVLRRFTWDLRPERRFITPLLLLLLAVLFALHCRMAYVRPDEAAAFAWQTIARYFLASMVLLLFLRSREAGDARRTGLPPSLGLFHLASVMAAGQVLLLDDRYAVFRVTELLSVTLVILYAATDHDRGSWPWAVPHLPLTASGSRPPVGNRPLWFGPTFGLSLLLLLALNLGWIGGSLLYRHVDIVNFLPAWLWQASFTQDSTMVEASRLGFSTSGRLSSVLSIKEDLDSTPVLSVTCETNPGYLRAMAFEMYSESEWHDLSNKETLYPESGALLSAVRRTSLFRLHGKEATREIAVRHESPVGDTVFTPLGTCSVEVPFGVGVLMGDDDDIVRTMIPRPRLSYRVNYAASARERPAASGQMGRMLDLPTAFQMNTFLRQRANLIFSGCTTTAEKIEAVTKYFHTTYTYALGLEVPPGRDSLEYFLRTASTGYCEYFASGAAILLRFEGVPTRYVTGFLITERGDDGRSWVARNMDAHAWAEAWDEQRQEWVIVEATTQEGLADASLADELARGAGQGLPFLAQLVRDLYEYGLFGVMARLFESYGLLTGVLTSMAFLGVALWVARWRRRPLGLFRPRSPEVLALHRLLAAMDGRVKALGFRRRPEETLHAFAARIRQPGSPSVDWWRGSLREPSDVGRNETRHRWTPDVAGWYLEYADLRFGPAIPPARLEQLQQLAQKLQREK